MDSNDNMEDDICVSLTQLFSEINSDNGSISTGTIPKRIISNERRDLELSKNVFDIFNNCNTERSENSYLRKREDRGIFSHWGNNSNITDENRPFRSNNNQERDTSISRGRNFEARDSKFINRNNRKDNYTWKHTTVPKENIDKLDVLKSDELNIYVIEELEPNNIVKEIVEKMQYFVKILQSNLAFNDIVLLLRVIDKICLSNLSDEKCKIIMRIIHTQFLYTLQEHLLTIAIHDSNDKEEHEIFWNNPEEFWNNLFMFYETIFNLVPQTAGEKLPKIVKATILSLTDIEKYHNITTSNDVKEKLQSFNKKILSNNNTSGDMLEPPNNFREMNIYPTVEEITTEEKPFIRPIIKDGVYQSVEHYLDVQFRLLKEDFTASLRNGICTHLKTGTSSPADKQFDVRIYENVQLIRPVTTKNAVGRLIQYTEKVNKKDIANSKRFMYGSLVCFTYDGFKSIAFGIVIDGSSSYLEKGQIIVDIKSGFIERGYDYVMVECTVFFEPYFQILKALQNVDESNFPFKEYIIDVSSDTKPPKYLNKSTKAIITGINDEHLCTVLSPETWPKPEQVRLNESQFKALQNALTNEFCVIQGPPGTGKTHTTLRIVECLLYSRRLLQYEGPIFVICLTNHALDQFLEGILLNTKDLVRVGGQSKNKALEKYNIARYRKILQKTRRRAKKEKLKRRLNKFDEWSDDEEDYDFSDFPMSCQLADEYYTYLREIMEVENDLEQISLNDGIINFEHFKTNILRMFGLQKPVEIINWLLNENEHLENVNKEKVEKYGMKNDDIFFQLFNEEKKDDDLVDFKFNELETDSCYILTTEGYLRHIRKLQAYLKRLDLSYEKRAQIKHQIEIYQKKYNHLLWRLNQYNDSGLFVNEMDPETKFELDDRWESYWFWVEELVNLLHLKMTRKSHILHSIDHECFQQVNDIYIMNKMRVIGMTTTGAARNQKILQQLQCPIVIAEEAAEVLESHIVASLTKDCKQLILIGDHKQLRPSTAQHFLATKYNLEVSLFERMVRNGIHCTQLNIQHRMRPEIASLIVPAIYPELQNHKSVENYPPVRGVTKNVFFVSHTHYEDIVTDSSSHANEYEARYIIEFANYLINQGYEPSDITILTTYLGQMYCIKNIISKRYILSNIRVTVVDNFQGEENKIILLSLVRSNEHANIGFLKIENRVCVALSRAKEGFFIIGNMDNLEKSSTVWPKIKEALLKQNAISHFLKLKCEIHSTFTEIHRPEDFEQVPLGGCNLMCNATLPCGHICPQKCHPNDKKHELYFCNEERKKQCPRKHILLGICSAEFKVCNVLIKTQLPCKHTVSLPCSIEPEDYECKVIVVAKLPCGHISGKPCSEDITKAKCLHPCDIFLMCGHKCSKTCHVHEDPLLKNVPDCKEPCTRSKKGCSTKKHQCPLLCFEECPPCTDIIKKRRTICKHMYKVECSSDVDKLVCRQNCRKFLPCGHYCPNKCFQPCGNCHVMVTKTIEDCGHNIKIRCYLEATKLMCKEKCSLLLSCGHLCKNNCNETCSEKCKECS